MTFMELILISPLDLNLKTIKIQAVLSSLDITQNS
jgi:hypothetical protein